MENLECDICVDYSGLFVGDREIRSVWPSEMNKKPQELDSFESITVSVKVETIELISGPLVCSKRHS